MTEVILFYVAVVLTVTIFSELYAIWTRGIEHTEHQARQTKVALAWPVFVIAGIAYFVTLGIVYAAEGNLAAAQRRLDNRRRKGKKIKTTLICRKCSQPRGLLHIHLVRRWRKPPRQVH